MPLASPGSVSVGPNGTPQTPSVKLELWKNWTISTYKCSRQTILERLGKTTRTVDVELESQIEALRDTQRKYSNVLRLARALTSHFYHVVQTQASDRTVKEEREDTCQNQVQILILAQPKLNC